jgi:hypothetical protein
MSDILLYIFMYALISSLLKIAHGSRYLPDEVSANMSVAFHTFTELFVSAIGLLIFLAIFVVDRLNQ